VLHRGVAVQGRSRAGQQRRRVCAWLVPLL